jgi:hypothetical protein
MIIEFARTTPLAELFPPSAAKKCIPEWYKKLDSEIEETQFCGATNFSVKKCVPVLDFMTSGYIIKNYADIYVKKSWSESNGEEFNIDFKFSVNPAPISTHTKEQYPLKVNGHDKKVFKFTGVWSIKTPPGYSCLICQPEYFNENRFRIFPAIVDTDEFIEPISFPFTFNNNQETEEYIIEAGTPLAYVLPFKREEWDSKITTYNENNKSSLLMKTIWQSAYKKFMHQKKKFN